MHDSRQWTEQSSCRRHALSWPFYAQTFVPMCQGRYFNHTFDRMHYPNRSILCIVCALFGSLASLEIIPLVAPGILSTFFFNPFILHIDNKFKPPPWDRGFLFQNPYTFTHFCDHTPIYSFSNWFICSDFDYFFYSKDFFISYKIFSTSYIARGIIKLIGKRGPLLFWRNAWNLKSRD